MMKPAWLSIGCSLFAWVGYGQAPRPAFEVATIRVNPHCEGGAALNRGMTTPGRIAMECADLRDLILAAYVIFADGANPTPGSFRMQVSGGPAWLDSTRYDIVAKASGNSPRSEMLGPMMRSLLEDRLKLEVHRETREAPVYLLTVSNRGPKLPATKEGACVVTDVNHPRDAGQFATPICGGQHIAPDGTVQFLGASMANLCQQLGMAMDREVIDNTGLAGRFDIHLKVSPSELAPRFVAGRTIEQPDPPAGDAIPGPSISTALQQVGLKLKSAKGHVESVVLDHIEQPTEN